jgi:acyl dehydratase
MALDPAIVGTTTPPHSVDVERGRLRFFAQATGQTDPIYLDPEAARSAGHPDLPVPPTFLMCLDLDQPDPSSWLKTLNVDVRTVLHGEQSFDYVRMAYAGDRLTFQTRVSDAYAKKGGALEFVVRTTDVTREGEPIATLSDTIVLLTGSAR